MSVSISVNIYVTYLWLVCKIIFFFRFDLGKREGELRYYSSVIIISICRIARLTRNASTIIVNYKILRSNTSEITVRIAKACSKTRRSIMYVHMLYARRSVGSDRGIRVHVTRYQIKDIVNRIYRERNIQVLLDRERG